EQRDEERSAAHAARTLHHPRRPRGLPLQAVERSAQLPEQLLVPLRRKALLHGVEVVLVQVELPARKARRARAARARARLRAISALRRRSREAGEALTLAGPQIEVLAARLRAELGAVDVL